MNVRQLRRRLAKLRRDARAILDPAITEERDLTEDETEQLSELRAKIKRAEEQIELAEDLEDDETVEEADSADDERSTSDDTETRSGSAYQELVDQHRSRVGGGSSAGATGADVQVRSEPLTYGRHNVRSSYFADLALQRLGIDSPDGGGEERLERHAAEMRVEIPRFERRLFGTASDPAVRSVTDEVGRERRQVESLIGYERRDLDSSATSGGEFIPPLWMIEDYIALSRAGRVTADLSRMIPLPGGTNSINMPRITGGTTVAMQTADNAAVSETDAVTDSVEAPVRTVAGQQDISLQLLEQSPIAFDQVIFEDLAGDLAEVTDLQVINGSGSSGQVLGYLQIPSVDTTTYTDASPTVPELYPKLADSANEVATNRFRAPTAVIMHPRRWYWMLASVDSSNRPFVVMSAQGPQNALAVADANAAEGLVGMSPFGPIFIDPNVPTNLGAGSDEDRIIVGRPNESLLFEGAVRTRVLPEVGSGTLTVRLQLYRYVAFMPQRRPENTSIVAGTGLIAPTF